MVNSGDRSEQAFTHLELDRQFCFALCRATRVITRCYNERLAPHHINYSQYLVLLTLWEEDGLRACTIAQRVRLDPSSLTPILKRLDALGLVVRERPEDNQRQINVSLTDAGWRLRQYISGVQIGVAEDTGLSPAQLSALTADLHAVADTLEAVGESVNAMV